jgi:3',5'-cyclic AMP phosphodiesterase CpdA
MLEKPLQMMKTSGQILQSGVNIAQEGVSATLKAARPPVREAVAATVGAAKLSAELTRRTVDNRWRLSIIVMLFVIHLMRLGLEWSSRGVVALPIIVAADVVLGLLLGVCLVLTLKQMWRAVITPIERRAKNRLKEKLDHNPSLGRVDTLLQQWLEHRYRTVAITDKVTFCLKDLLNGLRGKGSPKVSLRRELKDLIVGGLQLGLLPITVLVAINPVWGFTWVFNTENWAGGVLQTVAWYRTDAWREQMTTAVRQHYTNKDIPEESVFTVQPERLDPQSRRFSFLVIGDPGEGDASQHVLRDQYLLRDRADEMRFLLLSSDIVYPSGAMSDYERKFYLPFKGMTKPIYALPGNHDWHDELEGFTANFYEKEAAQAAYQGRGKKDCALSRNKDDRLCTYIDAAARLRDQYKLKTGLQRSMYFQIETDRFALFAVDTGLRRRVDPQQFGWLERALAKAQERGKFKMVILGHPLYVHGQYQGQVGNDFDKIHALLKEYEVDIVMAGDTHYFEYYNTMYEQDGTQKAMHHFVNGGGGAYLSLGTPLGWPRESIAVQDQTNPVRPQQCRRSDWGTSGVLGLITSPLVNMRMIKPAGDIRTYAFYPHERKLIEKLDQQTPSWKCPLWVWARDFRAFPFSPEDFSAAFDFNEAPFYQSFVEVEVDADAGVVRVIPYGALGPLTWEDFHTSVPVTSSNYKDRANNVVFEMPLPSQQVSVAAFPR